MSQHSLVLDLGSHGSRIAVFSPQAALLYLDSVELSSHTLGQQVEQSADEILHSFESLLEQLPAAQLKQISSAGLCTQRSSFLAWDRTSGEALSPVISWRDLRTLDELHRYSSATTTIHGLTGLRLSAHYSASKMHWLIHQQPELLDNPNLCLSPVASYLMFHLLDQAPCLIDHSNAQRTLLFDIHSLGWSEPLLNLFELSPSLLPECRPVVHEYGHLKADKVPLRCVCGDQNAAFHAYPDLAAQDALVNLGTGAFILSDIREKTHTGTSSSRLLKSLVYSDALQARFVTEATVNGAGASLSWLEQALPPQTDTLYPQLDEWLHTINPDGVFLNFVAGLGSPWWCSPGDSGFIPETGMNIAQKYVALIESIVFMLFYNLQQLEHMPENIFICGGLSRLNGLCQKLSSLSQRPVLRHPEIEASALGCAHLSQPAGQFEIHQILERLFKPQEDILISQRYTQFVGELNKRCHNS